MLPSCLPVCLPAGLPVYPPRSEGIGMEMPGRIELGRKEVELNPLI